MPENTRNVIDRIIGHILGVRPPDPVLVIFSPDIAKVAFRIVRKTFRMLLPVQLAAAGVARLAYLGVLLNPGPVYDRRST